MDKKQNIATMHKQCNYKNLKMCDWWNA